MKKLASIILVLLAVSLLPLIPLPAQAVDRGIQPVARLEKISGKTVGQYRALIIGINDYQDEKIDDLKTAVNDAREMSRALKSDYGFDDVTLLLNEQANESNIIHSLRILATQSKPDDSVLIYYAGHGELDRLTKAGYWIPHNAIGGDPATYIDNAIIQRYIKAIPARHVLLVADSCFSGALFGEERSVPPINDKFYAALFKEKSRWGMTSGNLTPVSDSGSGGHSIFAYHFLKTLRESQKPYLTPREIYQRIGPIIRNNTEQMPITRPIKNTGDEGGEFVFIRTASLSLEPSFVSPALEPPPVQVPSAPAPVVLQGHLQINVNAPSSQIKINGESKGTAAPDRPLNLQNLPTGTVNILVTAEGFESLQRTVSIQRNQWTQEVFELSRTKVARLEPPTPPEPKPSGKCPQKMSFIPPGEFMAGEMYRLYEMSINAFCMDQYEVTQSEYERVMGYNPSYFKGENLPVESVTWNKAEAYCEKVGKRLPAEWEWEKAAKAGTTTVYYWGDEMDGAYAWYYENSGRKTHPVGTKEANAWGLYDMLGNVWEWTASDYDDSKRYKVLRGGSWGLNPYVVRSALRTWVAPTDRLLNLGFRCASPFRP